MDRNTLAALAQGPLEQLQLPAPLGGRWRALVSSDIGACENDRRKGSNGECEHREARGPRVARKRGQGGRKR
eukprot:13487592-Alexandrium_andersonii.AAC.1